MPEAGMIAFFVIVAVAFVVLVVLGGCYSAKGKVGFLTRKFIAGLSGKNTSQGGNAQKTMQPSNSRKKKFTASSGQAKAGGVQASTKSAANSHRRNLTAKNMRRQATKLTGSGASINSGAVTLRGGTGLSADQILDVSAQNSTRTQQIPFTGAYISYNPNASVAQTTSHQATAYDTLKAAGGASMPGNHNDAMTDYIATYGSPGKNR